MSTETIDPGGSDPAPKARWLDKLLTELGCIWDIFQDVGQVLKYTRLSLLITLLAGLALIFVDQGQDLMVIRAEEPEFRPRLWFYLAVVFWAVNAWYWARATLQHGATIRWQESETCQKRRYFGGRLERVKWLVRQVPRAIGTGAFVMIAIAQLVAAASYSGLAADDTSTLYFFGFVSLALAAVFFALTAFRREIARAIGPAVASATGQVIGSDWRLLPDQPAHMTVERVGELPASLKITFVALSSGVLALFVLVTVSPTAFSLFGSDIVFFVGASLWIAPGTWLLFISKRGDLPVLTLLLVLALGFSFFNDNHDLRISTDDPLLDPANRPALAEAVDAWQADDSTPDAMIIVATAGGGSRAAYWTASVLGTIQDLCPDFDDQLFGISGVSGGSVGASVYRALLTALPDGDGPCKVKKKDAEGERTFRGYAKAILGEDFLAPTVAAMLYPDLVQRFLPVDVLPDRAAALEQAWEGAWSDAMTSSDWHGLFAGDFLAVWPRDADNQKRSLLPALFLNGTSVATGKRIVTSNLNVADSLTDAFDFFSHWPMNIPMSTAAHNSARFPFVSPAGTTHRCAAGEDLDTVDRIVDGGYFENFGSATALDLLRDMRRGSCGVSWTCADELIVIQISSDPGYSGVERRSDVELAEAENGSPLPEPSPGTFAAEVQSPVKTLLNTRTARGILAAQELHDWVVDLNALMSKRGAAAHFIEFRLDIAEGDTAPPLGWVLSEVAETTMDCQMLRPSNRRNLEKLVELLGFDTKTAESLDGISHQCP